MLNLVLKIAALVAFVLTLGVLVVYVPDKDLIAVLLIVIAMAIYDFLVRPLLTRNGDGQR